jgi:2-haloacid dehalogenase
MPINAFVFDAYGTLFDVHSVIARCEQVWPGQGNAVSQLWRAKQLEYTWLRSLMNCYEDFERVTTDALRYACEQLRLDCDESKIALLMGEYSRLNTFPEIKLALPQLKPKTLAILSNGTQGMLDAVVGHTGLDKVLDTVISVDELRVFKPDPRVYQLAVTKLGLRPENIGFVSSNCWDACGAKNFGFRSYWINRSGAPVDRLGVVPDAIIASLSDLPQHVT